ncbi:G2/M phase-specific E3 ubiquitin-protein ligase isoform X3 [Danio rerio]|uniref:G2/M phase-specific E3 ubiquitin-protein ligase isoform X3 n=1 Tax=Danio rerio TaxID=7955 RepID=A0AC58JBF0_DANRE
MNREGECEGCSEDAEQARCMDQELGAATKSIKNVIRELKHNEELMSSSGHFLQTSELQPSHMPHQFSCDSLSEGSVSAVDSEIPDIPEDDSFSQNTDTAMDSVLLAAITMAKAEALLMQCRMMIIFIRVLPLPSQWFTGDQDHNFFHQAFIRALTTSPEATLITVEEVKEPMLCSLQRLASGDYDTVENIVNILDMAWTFAIVNDFQTARKVALDTAHWYCLERSSSAFERFKEGLKTLGVLEAMRENPASFSRVMCHHPQQFTYMSFFTMMRTELNLPGSSKRNTDNLVLSFWRNLLVEIKDNSSELQYSDIFFTAGLITLPPLGLRPHPGIYFLHSTEESEMLLLPKASTCAKILHLQVVHQTYTDIKSNMTYAI